MVEKTFNYNIDGKEVEFGFREPDAKDIREAKKVYNATLNEALNTEPPSPLRAKLDAILKRQGIWNEEKQAKYTSLNQELISGIRKLETGGFSLLEAKELALRLLKLREEIRELIAERGQMDSITAEGQAENARFQYLVSACLVTTVYNKPYYKSYDDFVQHSEEPLSYIACNHFMNLQYGFSDEDNIPEHKFLKKFKFADDKLRLIDKNGRLVDEDGKLINEDGRYINESGEFIDSEGNAVTEDGKPIYSFQGYTLDDGTVVGLEEKEVVEVKVEEVVSE